MIFAKYSCGQTVNFMQRRGTLDDPAYYLHCAKFLRVFLQIDVTLGQVNIYDGQLIYINTEVIRAPLTIGPHVQIPTKFVVKKA